MAWRLPAGSITQRWGFVIPYNAICIFRETGTFFPFWLLADGHCQLRAYGLIRHIVGVRGGRKHAPATVVMSEEKQASGSRRERRFNSHVASATGTGATEFGYANGHGRPRSEPFFDEKTQGMLAGGSHDPLHVRSP
jgi:hypothetical protein